MPYEINAKSRTLAPIDNLGIEWDVGTEVLGCGVEIDTTEDRFVFVPPGTYDVEAYIEFAAAEATTASLEWVTTDFMSSGTLDSYSGSAATTLTLSATGWTTAVDVFLLVGHSIQGGSATVMPASYLHVECLVAAWHTGFIGWSGGPTSTFAPDLTTTTSIGADITPDLPAGNTGDQLVGFLIVENDPATITDWDGWTPLNTSQFNTSQQITAVTKVRGASEPSPTWVATVDAGDRVFVATIANLATGTYDDLVDEQIDYLANTIPDTGSVAITAQMLGVAYTQNVTDPPVITPPTGDYAEVQVPVPNLFAGVNAYMTVFAYEGSTAPTFDIDADTEFSDRITMVIGST